MIDETKDESCGLEHLPQSELEASPGLSTPQTSIDMDKLPSHDANAPTSTSDDAESEQEFHFEPQPDESRGIEHLPQSELEASPGVSRAD